MGPKLTTFFTILGKTTYTTTKTHLGLEHVHRPADVCVHSVSLKAQEDSLLQSQTQGAAVDEAEEDTDELNKQNASDTDAILQLSS